MLLISKVDGDNLSTSPYTALKMQATTTDTSDN